MHGSMHAVGNYHAISRKQLDKRIKENKKALLGNDSESSDSSVSSISKVRIQGWKWDGIGIYYSENASEFKYKNETGLIGILFTYD